MFSQFKIGLRTTKTAISVALSVIICALLSRETPMIAALASVFCLRQDTSSSIKFSIHRISGTLIGGLISIGAISVQHLIGRNPIYDALVAGIAVTLTIMICNAVNHKEGIITAVSSLLFILFNTPHTESVIGAILRLIDVIIGALVAVSVDYILPSKQKIPR